MSLLVAIVNGKQPSAGVGGVSDSDLLNIANNFLNKGIVISSDLALTLTSGLGISIASGHVYIPNPAGTVLYPVTLDSAHTDTAPSNATGNDRYSTLVIKLDLVTTPDNLADNIATFVWVNGTSGVTPSAPSDATIQTAVGASNGFIRLFDIYVANGAVTLSGGNVVDRRTQAYFNGLLQSDGWTNSTDTWTWVSATSFKITGVDRTKTYTKGTRIKCTNNGVTFYGVVTASSFSTDTTITLAANTDYSLANSAITNPFYSYDVNPQGYPTWFNFTPTWSGFSSNPPVDIARFAILGSMCTITLHCTSTGTSNQTFTNMTAIPAPATGFAMAFSTITNNGASNYGNVFVQNGDTQITGGLTFSNGGFTASGGKAMNFTITYSF